MTLDIMQVGDFVLFYGCMLYHFIGKIASYDFKYNPNDKNLDIIAKPFQATKRTITEQIKTHLLKQMNKSNAQQTFNSLNDNRKTIQKLYDCRDFHFVQVLPNWLDNAPKTYSEWMKNVKSTPPPNWKPPDVNPYRKSLERFIPSTTKSQNIVNIDSTFLYTRTTTAAARPTLTEYLNNNDISMNDEIMSILGSYNFLKDPNSNTIKKK
ncbi:3997_t:CDS:1 [Diversispora eburnea]|uniref:3997_t:CDS:1 n=1 Tax=Diversispora eburnea TaxID=1213867 RepID=A0A9N9AZI9_9GLOM|nr:3997_t:CDS:1 [Diversispora eburnea]